MGKLDQKVAVLTGAARDPGKQIALTFAREGAGLAICDVLTGEMAATAREISGLGRQVIAVRAGPGPVFESDCPPDSDKNA
ncbi:MAG: hypothetical protein HY668_01655 [Chloroflexi bacterium]|nr:hypothetical protein [Chloroflexota bacterium]